MREEYIQRNETNDVFCAGCLKATDKGAKSHCCDKDVITKQEALSRIPKIKERLQGML
jgi:hypothetical protein